MQLTDSRGDHIHSENMMSPDVIMTDPEELFHDTRASGRGSTEEVR